MSTTYSVRLPVFEGPLDLLLHLIEERELDITKVSLATVTDQYLDYIANLSDPDPAKMADFLVIAAKLLLIKSRVLLPQPPPDIAASEEEDVGDELVRRLIEYRRFKNAAQRLRAREEEGLRAYPRMVPTNQPEGVMRLEDVTLNALLEAVRQAMTAKEASSADDVVTPLRISLPEKIAVLEGLLTDRGSFSFNQVLAQTESRSEVIVTFLALLQLIKRRKIRVEQRSLFGEIVISAAE